jgi:hypothetical protein
VPTTLKATSCGVLREEVATLGLERAGVGAERGEDQRSFFGAEALEQRRVGDEDARAWRVARWSGEGGLPRVGEGLEQALRGGAAGLREDGGHGVGGAEAMDLVARDFEDGHGGEGLHHAAVLLREVAHGIAAGDALDAGFPAGKDEAGGETLDVVLEGTADGLVEVIDVEDQAAVEGGVGSEVEDVGVAAELGGDAGVGMAGEVGGHDGDGAAKEAEGAGGHALVLDGE